MAFLKAFLQCLMIYFYSRLRISLKALLLALGFVLLCLFLFVFVLNKCNWMEFEEVFQGGKSTTDLCRHRDLNVKWHCVLTYKNMTALLYKPLHKFHRQVLQMKKTMFSYTGETSMT